MTGITRFRNNENARKVLIYYAEAKSGLRMTMRSTLNREGFEDVRDFGSLEQLWTAVHAKAPDLVLVDAEMVTEEADGARFMRDIRYGQLGNNPYIPIICTVWNSQQEMISQLINAGPDDLLLKPFSPADLFGRIDALVSRRKPFVITSDYIGPDRRKDEARREEENLLDVPNTLKQKMAGEAIDPDELQAAIQSTNHDVNEMKLKRNAFHISFLVRLLLPLFEKQGYDEDKRSHLEAMRKSADDTMARLTDTQLGHVAELCRTLIDISTSLENSLARPEIKDIKLLKRLSQAVLLAFNPGTDAEILSHQISSAVSKYDARKQAKTVTAS